MELVKAAEYAGFKMIEHGLMDKGWKFQFDTAVRTFGYCHHGKRTISLSKPLTELNDEQEVKDTILHELAHALCPRGEGHGELWKQKCREIGAKPIRCYSSRTVAIPEVTKYRYECPNCGRHVIKTYVMRKSLRACGPCCRKHNNNVFSRDYVYQLVETIRPKGEEIPAPAAKRRWKVGEKYNG